VELFRAHEDERTSLASGKTCGNEVTARKLIANANEI
jgi:hypothetical protein